MAGPIPAIHVFHLVVFIRRLCPVYRANGTTTILGMVMARQDEPGIKAQFVPAKNDTIDCINSVCQTAFALALALERRHRFIELLRAIYWQHVCKEQGVCLA